MKLFSYVVEHDIGLGPNPEDNVCTLVYCKYKERDTNRRNIVELAEEGDWILGTGGKNKKKSTGHGTIVYIMRVDEKLSFGKYLRCFPNRRRPKRSWRKEHGMFALVSTTFFYFGRNAIRVTEIPAALRRRLGHPIEKKGPAFRKDFPEGFICQLAGWVQETYEIGKHGEPCVPGSDRITTKTCRCRE